jgi:putative DNA primase/helicase
VSFTDPQAEILGRRGISISQAEAAGVVPTQTEADLPEGVPDYWTVENGYLPGLLFWWRSPDGITEIPQLRPDVPVVDLKADGDAEKVKKYVFPPDTPSVLHAARPASRDDDVVLITEGTIQTLSASIHAFGGVAVYGIAGCQSWMKCGVPTRDLSVVKGREVHIVLDADASTNLAVYNAGVALREALLAEDAVSVRFIRIPGSAKSGLDDVLASRDPDSRGEYIDKLIEISRKRPRTEKPDLPAAVKPKPKAATGGDSESPFFTSSGGLLVKTLVETVIGNQPVALTRENKVAVYRHGVYQIDGTGFLGELTGLLGEQFRSSHRSNAEEFAVGMLKQAGRVLPDRQREPLMNTLSGMVDLRTGKLSEHDPTLYSTVQFPVEWDPEATCPTYEAWAATQVGDQLDDLEESVSVMLDPSVTPTKAVFLFGPSRTGKGTYLRIVSAIAGQENTSGVTLHQLSDNRFMSASLYGKTLNVSGDLSAAHVEDISVFKMMTGEDLIRADRKFGNQFDFINRALFLFSANELPTVGESSRAYAERVKPFLFSRTFAGAEDPALEARILDELPGILVRLQRAYQRRLERGRPLPTNPAVQEAFEAASDRVRQFVRDCCEVVPVQVGQGGSKGGGISTISQVYGAFQRWAAAEGKATLAKSKLKMRLSNVPAVVESVSSGKSRGWNLRILPESEWGIRVSDAPQSEVQVPVTGKEDALQERGTLSVLTPLQPDVDSLSLKDQLARETHAKCEEVGSERTKFQGHDHDFSASAENNLLVEYLRQRAVPADLTTTWRQCPECDATEQLDASGWLYSCPQCHPASFRPTES